MQVKVFLIIPDETVCYCSYIFVPIYADRVHILQVVVVEDSASLKNIPPVTGMLAYQKDNQSLHVLMNDTWKAVAVEEKVYELFLEKKLMNHLQLPINKYIYEKYKTMHLRFNISITRVRWFPTVSTVT